MAMLIPEAWDEDTTCPPRSAHVTKFTASLTGKRGMGPRGRVHRCRMIGATLIANGLRPARYLVTTGNQLILAVTKNRRAPGKPGTWSRRAVWQPGKDSCWSISTTLGTGPRHRARRGDQDPLGRANTYGEMARRESIRLEELPRPRVFTRIRSGTFSSAARVRIQRRRPEPADGPMASNGRSRLARWEQYAASVSFGNRPQPLFNYFQAALRAGDESRDRSDSRGVGSCSAHQLHRTPSQHSRGNAAQPMPPREAAPRAADQSRSRKARR